MIVHDSIERNPGDDNQPKRDNYLKIRNVLNILFMLIAIVGVVIYVFFNHDHGIIVVIVSMAFKFVECSLRLIR